MARLSYSVPDITCPGCADEVKEDLSGIDGVQDVTVDVEERRVTITFLPERTSQEQIADELAYAGFPTAEQKAREEAARRPARGLWYGPLALAAVAVGLIGYVGYELYPRFGLPALEGWALLALAAGAGVASFFSPCAFSLLVALLARETGAGTARREVSFRRAAGFATALAIGAATFVVLAGAIIALGGGALLGGVTFESAAGRILRVGVGLLLIALGLMQSGVLKNLLGPPGEAMARRWIRLQAGLRRRNPTLSFGVLGFGYLLAGFG